MSEHDTRRGRETSHDTMANHEICLYECTDPTFILKEYLHCWCQLFVAFQQRKVERSYFRSYHESILNIYRPKKKGFINL